MYRTTGWISPKPENTGVRHPLEVTIQRVAPPPATIIQVSSSQLRHTPFSAFNLFSRIWSTGSDVPVLPTDGSQHHITHDIPRVIGQPVMADFLHEWCWLEVTNITAVKSLCWVSNGKYTLCASTGRGIVAFLHGSSFTGTVSQYLLWQHERHISTKSNISTGRYIESDYCVEIQLEQTLCINQRGTKHGAVNCRKNPAGNKTWSEQNVVSDSGRDGSEEKHSRHSFSYSLANFSVIINQLRPLWLVIRTQSNYDTSARTRSSSPHPIDPGVSGLQGVVKHSRQSFSYSLANFSVIINQLRPLWLVIRTQSNYDTSARTRSSSPHPIDPGVSGLQGVVKHSRQSFSYSLANFSVIINQLRPLWLVIRTQSNYDTSARTRSSSPHPIDPGVSGLQGVVKHIVTSIICSWDSHLGRVSFCQEVNVKRVTDRQFPDVYCKTRGDRLWRCPAFQLFNNGVI
ncbi:hypothetical protein J6590_032201 [Homalodisca vitripennis]|nr:hypothetical protein J6590_032201 [Homalodisca vitripennis]